MFGINGSEWRTRVGIGGNSATFISTGRCYRRQILSASASSMSTQRAAAAPMPDGAQLKKRRLTPASAAAPAVIAPMVPLDQVLDVAEFDKMNEEMKVWRGIQSH